MADESALIARVLDGDRAAFDALAAPHQARLESFLLRLVANPDDARDLAQETLLQAFRKLRDYRGESSFGTWLFSIGTRLGLTHLRTRKRWPTTTQLEMHERCHEDAEFLGELGQELGRQDFRYEVAEHVAYCFACVGRALDPEESAAVILTEIFELPNAEAARILGMSESVLRHRLAAGRQTMTQAFDGLCALVAKQGACHQCSILRDAAPADRRGPEVPRLGDVDAQHEAPDARFARRLEVLRTGDLAHGPTARVHALMMRYIAKNVE
jgi:RNA polymerase sigma-70 factor (ECF subfamily)